MLFSYSKCYWGAIQKQRDFLLCFIDYTKTFDGVWHELLQILEKLDFIQEIYQSNL